MPVFSGYHVLEYLILPVLHKIEHALLGDISVINTYTPSTRQRQGFRNYIPLLHRRDNPYFVGMIYPCSVGLVDILRIRVCQHIHVVKEVDSKFVYNIFKMVLQKNASSVMNYTTKI